MDPCQRFVPLGGTDEYVSQAVIAGDIRRRYEPREHDRPGKFQYELADRVGIFIACVAAVPFAARDDQRGVRVGLHHFFHCIDQYVDSLFYTQPAHVQDDPVVLQAIFRLYFKFLRRPCFSPRRIILFRVDSGIHHAHFRLSSREATGDRACDVSAHGIDELCFFDTFEAGIVGDLLSMHHLVMQAEAEPGPGEPFRQCQEEFRPVKDVDQFERRSVLIDGCRDALSNILYISGLRFSGHSYIPYVFPDFFLRQAGVLDAKNRYIVMRRQVRKDTFYIHLDRTARHWRYRELFSTDEGYLQVNHSF